MSRRRVLAEHTSRELSEWLALYRLEEVERQQAEAALGPLSRGGRATVRGLRGVRP